MRRSESENFAGESCRLDISVIMPCYNRSHDLLKVLQAYENQIGGEIFEIIAVDDASNDDTPQLLTTYSPTKYRLNFYRQEKNQGPAAARNLALSHAKAPLLLFVGDDIIPELDFIHEHIQAHRRYPEKEVAILGKIVWPNDMPRNTLMSHIDGVGAQQFSYFYLKNGEEYDFRHFYTANISLKWEMLNTVKKWFDTEFPYAAFEDVELSYRLSRKGMRIVYSDAPKVKHYHYHNIWTFSKRQYNSGLMACVLSSKHLGVAWFFKGQFRKVILLWIKSLFFSNDSENVDWLETIGLRIANSFEWQNHPMLDKLYLDILEYYYYKGLIDGTFKWWQKRQKIHLFHARTALTPILLSFLESNENSDVDLSVYQNRLLEKLSDL